MDLIKTRQYLHQFPEVSDQEVKTSKFIVKKLKEIGVSKVQKIAKTTGILAEINAQKPGKTLLFRAELDALPIQEQNPELSYASKTKGVSHKCGHDGHMTILLGLAQKLLQEKDFSGKILLLFQPSEENGKGAKAVMESKILENYEIDYVFALHNIPKYPLKKVICKPGNFTPSVESLEVKLIGKTSHAGMPENGINPAKTIAELIRFYQSLHQPNHQKKDYFLSTPVYLQMGEKAYGISAGEGEISYTFRAYDDDFFQTQKVKIEKQTKEIIEKTTGLSSQLIWKEAFSANKNHLKAYEFIRQAAKENKLEFIEKEEGFSWGEDFGLFTQHFSGAMFGIGAGIDQPELHNPDYDFPDELLTPGIQMFYRLIKIIENE